MKQILLATALIALPVGMFSVGMSFFPSRPEQSAAPSLGDLSAMEAIVTDVQALAAKGDMKSAAARITDFETAWDDAQPRLQPINPEAWGMVDGAADAALSAVRAASPDPALVTSTLAALQTALADPVSGRVGTGEVQMVEGVAVSDANGHPIPCEDMLKQAKAGLAAVAADAAKTAAATDLIGKATERCNADDDRNADAFSAGALALTAQN
jgi:hypothetical protein